MGRCSNRLRDDLDIYSAIAYQISRFVLTLISNFHLNRQATNRKSIYTWYKNIKSNLKVRLRRTKGAFFKVNMGWEMSNI